MQTIVEERPHKIELRSWGHDRRQLTAIIINGVQVGKQFSAMDKTEAQIDKIIARRIEKYEAEHGATPGRLIEVHDSAGPEVETAYQP